MSDVIAGSNPERAPTPTVMNSAIARADRHTIWTSVNISHAYTKEELLRVARRDMRGYQVPAEWWGRFGLLEKRGVAFIEGALRPERTIDAIERKGLDATFEKLGKHRSGRKIWVFCSHPTCPPSMGSLSANLSVPDTPSG